jgi:hypothetical protein
MHMAMEQEAVLTVHHPEVDGTEDWDGEELVDSRHLTGASDGLVIEVRVRSMFRMTPGSAVCK